MTDIKNIIKFNNSKLIIFAILVNIGTISMLFSGQIQYFIIGIKYISIFDYYFTYLFALGLFNLFVLNKYLRNKDAKFVQELLKHVAAEKLNLDKDRLFNECRSKNIGLYINEYIPNRPFSILSMKHFNIKALNKENNIDKYFFKQDEIASPFFKFSDYAGKTVFYYSTYFVFGVILIPLLSLTLDKISVNNFTHKYEVKYQNIEYQITQKKEATELKSQTLNKLENLRAEYINEFGTGNVLINEIDNDINNLKK